MKCTSLVQKRVCYVDYKIIDKSKIVNIYILLYTHCPLSNIQN